MNICVHVLLFYVDMPSFLVGIYLGLEFLGHMETLFNLLRNCFEEFLGCLRVIAPFYIFNSVVCEEEAPGLCILSHTYLLFIIAVLVGVK